MELTEPPSNCNPSSADNYVAPPVRIPQTSFSCWGRYDGYYADVELDCVVFHYCQTWQFPTGVNETVKWDFFCPESTTFNQKLLACTRPTSALECYDSPEYYWVNYNLYNPVPETNKPQPVPTESHIPSHQSDSLQQGSVTYQNENGQYYAHEQASSPGGNNEGYAPSYPSNSDFYGNSQPVSHDQSNTKPVESYPTTVNNPNQYVGENFNEPTFGYSGAYDSSSAYYGPESSLPVEQNPTASRIPVVQNEPLQPQEITQPAGQYAENLNYSSSVSGTFSTEAPVQYPTELNTNSDVKPESPQEDIISIQFDVMFNFNPKGDKHPSGLNESLTGNSSSAHREEPAEQNTQEPVQASEAQNSHSAGSTFDESVAPTESFEPLATITDTTYSPDETPVGFTQYDGGAFSTELFSGQESTEQYLPGTNDTYEIPSTEETDADTAVDNESTVSSEVNATVSGGGQPPSVAHHEVSSQKPDSSFDKPIEPIVTFPDVLTPFAEEMETDSNDKSPFSEPKHNETGNANQFSDIVNFDNDATALPQGDNFGRDPNLPSRPYPIDLNNFQGSGEPPEKGNQDVDELVDQGPASAIKYFLIN